jgi:hypothetical protein
LVNNKESNPLYDLLSLGAKTFSNALKVLETKLSLNFNNLLDILSGAKENYLHLAIMNLNYLLQGGLGCIFD